MLTLGPFEMYSNNWWLIAYHIRKWEIVRRKTFSRIIRDRSHELFIGSSVTFASQPNIFLKEIENHCIAWEYFFTDISTSFEFSLSVMDAFNWLGMLRNGSECCLMSLPFKTIGVQFRTYFWWKEILLQWLIERTWCFNSPDLV